MSNKGILELHCHTLMSEGGGLIPPSELVKYAYDNGYKAVAITDRGSVQAFPKAYREWSRLWKQYQEECSDIGKEAVQEDFLKIIYGLEGNLLTEEGEVISVLIYVKNETGLRNLYKIVTASYLEYYDNKKPMIPKALLEEYRDGLIIGSADVIEEQIEYVNPLRVGKYWPEYPNAIEELTEICESRVKELFGEQPNYEVRKRLERELEAICQNGYASIYMLWRQIVKKSLDEGFPVGIRGAVGSSLVAYLCGITEINPLSQEFGGYNIPAEVFMGLNLDKEPDIDINFSPVIQETMQNYIKELPGVGETCYGGIITLTSSNGTIKKVNGFHPGGIIVCPEGEELVSFTPLSHPIYGEKVVTHFDYHDISDNLMKLDILGYDPYELLHFLQENTDIRIQDIPFDDEKTLAFICDVNTDFPEDFTEFGLNYFHSQYFRRIIKETVPKSFDDLVKISALGHGTDVWCDNQEELIKNKFINLTDCIASRDDIMIYLMEHGLDIEDAYQIMEWVRKGHGLMRGHMKLMKDAGIPNWYMQVCEKIKYLFPKAHAVSYTMLAVRLAYYRVYYPEVYQEGLVAIG